MNGPVLVVMAAGMGSRYGGLKQIDPVDERGHVILDFSLYDAWKAGFEEAVLIIRREHEDLFRESIGGRAASGMKVTYAYQDLDALPAPFRVPEGRQKPWGTGHAVLCAADAVAGRPFAVINADDYYGAHAFVRAREALEACTEGECALIGYRACNTLSESGAVSRGVCRVEDGFLKDVTERQISRTEGSSLPGEAGRQAGRTGDGAAFTSDGTGHPVSRTEGGVAFTPDGGATWEMIDPMTVVSMNLWVFRGSFMDTLREGFPTFLTKAMAENPLKGEYFLPSAVTAGLEAGTLRARVLISEDVWHGVTYPQDKAEVVSAMQALHADGTYPAALWPCEEA